MSILLHSFNLDSDRTECALVVFVLESSVIV